MKRGEIYYVLPAGMTSGHEIRSGRPAVIVSNDILNSTSDVVEICFLTTQPKRPMPTHVVTKASGLPSTIIAEQINAVSTSRVGEFIGVLSDEDLMHLDKALCASLGISCTEPEPAEPTTDDNTIAKLEAERDTYKRLFEDVMAKLIGGKA